MSNGFVAFALCSCDKNILHQIYHALLGFDVECPPPRIHSPAGYANKYDIRYNKDYWELKIGAKHALMRFCELIEPYLKHAKRRYDMNRTRENIEERNRRFGNRGM
ncbi:MAG: hypothetical protein CVU38_00370 [Chloroflexi bacterium HGW-Chloroflexi-1]|nr:MAG: hypothetical protein CVU38_00370 [Chloroflexi bacterium HGW-Chloroflexi-1]